MVNKKNLRYCQILKSNKYYEVMIAVSDLDEVDNILQEWSIEKFGEALNLPEALILNKDVTEVLRTVAVDNFVYLKSPVSTYMEMPRYAGISGTFPSLPDELSGGLYVAPETNVFIYSLPGFQGVFGEYSVPASTLELSPGINYLAISYNSGSPMWAFYNSFDSIDFSSIVPVATVFSFSGGVHNIPWGQTGYGLPEKLLKLIDRRKRFEILDPYALGNDGRYIELGEIVVSNGVEEIICAAIDTEAVDNDMYLYYKDGSSQWQTVKVTQLDNAQYQSGSGLAALSAGEFVVNQIFRVVDSGNLLLFNVLSDKFDTLQEAINSGEITDLPDAVKKSAVCVGRFIIEEGSSTPLPQKIQKISFGS